MNFNPTKSKLITFNRSSQLKDINVLFSGVDIPCVPDDIHLGHVLGPDASNKSIEIASRNMVNRANVLLAQFGYASCDVVYQLFKTRGSMVVNYGTGLRQWHLPCSRHGGK